MIVKTKGFVKSLLKLLPGEIRENLPLQTSDMGKKTVSLKAHSF